MVLKLVLLFFLCVLGVHSDMCPRQCDCDMEYGLYRAQCSHQNIVNIEIGVPKQVQVYSLMYNAISELDNYCFKNAGYTSLTSLSLSYNQIYWIGFHAFYELNELTYLDLSHNRLRHINSDVLWDVPALETLDLSDNMFETLENGPFLMHQKLQVLNLNNCRIKALPERLFTRLPNLRKLDLSHNYMITLSTQVLSPMMKLERLELWNQYLKCNTDFVTVEKWIISRGIDYDEQCKKRPNMMERMMAIPETQHEDIDIRKVWSIRNSTPAEVPKKKLSAFEKIDKEFSAFQAFIIGIEVGLGIGIVATYIWLKNLCKCGGFRWRRPQSRRERRRAQRLADDLRANLLWSNVIHPDLETPPPYRRELSLPDRSPPFPVYGVVGLNSLTTRNDDGADTPPPNYSTIDLRALRS